MSSFRFSHLLYYFLISIFLACKSIPQTKDYISLFSLANYPQHLHTWLKEKNLAYEALLLTPTQQKAHLSYFYEHYIGKSAPWHPEWIHKRLISPRLHLVVNSKGPQSIQDALQKSIQPITSSAQPAVPVGYRANFQHYTSSWLSTLKANLNSAQFDQKLAYDPTKRAIATENLMGRLLPTEEAYFIPQGPKKTYRPFDRMQNFTIWAGTPLYIIGETKDRAWTLVHTAYALTWVKSIGIAQVNEAFIRTWTNAAYQKLVAITHTHISLIDSEENLFRFLGFIGMVFPSAQSLQSSSKRYILIPVRDSKGKAHIHHAALDDQESTLVPMIPTITNFWKLMEQLIGRPYGRGNAYYYNECASELKNLLAPFGIWLPLYSLNQIDPNQALGKAITLSHLTVNKRLHWLRQHGHPFTTILYTPGHVMLYLGSYPDPTGRFQGLIALSYQNLWGFKSRLEDRRSIVGQSVLLPLTKNYPEDLELISQIQKPTLRVLLL